jgi:hypothetical protein
MTLRKETTRRSFVKGGVGAAAAGWALRACANREGV